MRSVERFSPDKGFHFKQRALDLEKDFARVDPENYLIRSDTMMLTKDQANQMFEQITVEHNTIKKKQWPDLQKNKSRI